MGARGAIIMGFFGAVFAALTMYWQWRLSGLVLALPFAAFVAIAIGAARVIRLPGPGIEPTRQEDRAILWSTIAEGVGLFVASNLVIDLHRPDLLLPSMALVVGLHFLPIAFAGGFRPFYFLGAALIAAASVGFAIGAPLGGELAGLAAACALWVAAGIAVLRDRRAKRNAMIGA